jgi:hypothetical protein
MAIDRIPGVGPTNTDVANAVAAAVPTNSSIANAVAAAVPTNSSIANAVAAAVPTNTSIANAVAAAVPSAANIQNLVTTYGNTYNGPSAATIANTVAAANNTNVTNIVQTYASAKSWRSQRFTSSGNWVAPTGVNYVKVFLVGGGGGTNQVSNAGGPGGGGGQVIEEIIAVTAGTTYAVNIGAGGAGTAGSRGSSGTASAFGNLLNAGGGGSGSWDNLEANLPNGGNRAGGAHLGGRGNADSNFSRTQPLATNGGGSSGGAKGSAGGLAGGGGGGGAGGPGGDVTNASPVGFGGPGYKGYGYGGKASTNNSYVVNQPNPAPNSGGGADGGVNVVTSGGSGYCYLEWEQ